MIGVREDSYYAGAAAADLAKRPNLGARPFVVLIRGLGHSQPPPDWLKWEKQLAQLSTSSMLVRAIAHPLLAPDLTAEAFRLVVVAARRGARLPPCAATRLPKDLLGTCLDPRSP
jgi:hypothetical protein